MKRPAEPSQADQNVLVFKWVMIMDAFIRGLFPAAKHVMRQAFTRLRVRAMVRTLFAPRPASFEFSSSITVAFDNVDALTCAEFTAAYRVLCDAARSQFQGNYPPGFPTQVILRSSDGRNHDTLITPYVSIQTPASGHVFANPGRSSSGVRIRC